MSGLMFLFAGIGVSAPDELSALILFFKTYSPAYHTGVYQATSVTDAQRRVQDLVETSLSALRVNVHSALNTNAKIIASWKELVDRFGPAK